LSRTRGGGVSVGLSSVDSANVADPAAGKVVRAKIIRVKSSPANRDYGRRGVITKGATIETELGEARVVSRPSDDGAVNAVLVKPR
jgi:small subunit ribosomal protein S8e